MSQPSPALYCGMSGHEISGPSTLWVIQENGSLVIGAQTFVAWCPSHVAEASSRWQTQWTPVVLGSSAEQCSWCHNSLPDAPVPSETSAPFTTYPVRYFAIHIVPPEAADPPTASYYLCASCGDALFERIHEQHGRFGEYAELLPSE